MADIELVIKIPTELYDLIQNKLDFNGDLKLKDIKTLMIAIDDGTPLPKGHGRLIDADALMYKQTHHGNYYTQFELIDRNDLSNAPTIIEADKAESEEYANEWIGYSR